MTMSLKPTPRSTFFAPKSLVTAVTAALMALSSSAMAVQTQPKPVDKLQQLINTSESNQKAAAAKSMANAQSTAMPDPDLDSDDAEDKAVQAQVNSEIAEQVSEDESDGEAVELAAPNKDDSSIKSIENKDGKIYKTTNLSNYARAVNEAVWTPNMRKNTAMSVKMQALLDWNHASPGPIDGGWGMNSTKALANFQTMRGLPSTGKMDTATWNELTKKINPKQPVLVQYTLTKEDANTPLAPTPSGSEAKSKMKGLYYQDIKEMLGERFHMDVRYLEKLNKGKRFVEGETITVINVGDPLKAKINRVIANKADKTLYAYNGNQLVATYPTTVGSTSTPSPTGTFKIVNKVKMPWYKSTVKNGDKKQVFMLPPGPNNPVGVVWMGLSKPSYGIHGSPVPEGISRQASAGCVRLTNWDVLEVYANIENGASVELK
ncbi:murein L,D-transpeptidase [Psychrobacter sp. YP14]|uniref:L,D-transpeptidase family protein n=3 Tax=Psychrobacter TaxID=497 RepID=A0A844LYX8_9GAMM|nr:MULTISPECIES: L,D-transpeptidase family protein [Psychrobacter]AWT48899.1 murein L,D-transpeptidase [Psychrobacter sp. YP14]MUG31876.1 L,D-transpeptidase family protein [Psychrobacter sanguinis]